MSSSENNMRVGIAGNALVVSFLTASPPRMWRTDMAQLLTAALEVQDNQGKHTLVMKRSGAAVEEIGTFAIKEDAVKALQLITEALLSGKDASSSATAGWFKKSLKILLKVIGGLFVLFITLNILGFILFGRHHTEGNFTKIPTAQTGVPAPADEILGK